MAVSEVAVLILDRLRMLCLFVPCSLLALLNAPVVPVFKLHPLLGDLLLWIARWPSLASAILGRRILRSLLTFFTASVERFFSSSWVKIR